MWIYLKKTGTQYHFSNQSLQEIWGTHAETCFHIKTNFAGVEVPLQWRRNERDGVSNHRRLDCLLIRLIRRRSRKTSKLRVNGLCKGNPPVTDGFPSQRTSNAQNVSIRWRHHVFLQYWYGRVTVWSFPLGFIDWWDIFPSLVHIEKLHYDYNWKHVENNQTHQLTVA